MDMYSTHDNQADNENIQGKLKLHEVRDLSDNVDEIIDRLKPIDYGLQDLDVLMELAKTLKHKRLALFPDTASILMSEGLNLYGAATNESSWLLA